MEKTNAIAVFNDHRLFADSFAARIEDYKPQEFISKSSGFDTILQCLTAIARGCQYTCPLISKILDHTDNTTKYHLQSGNWRYYSEWKLI